MVSNMKLRFLFAATLVLLFVQTISAQQVGDNINVLPVPGRTDAFDYLRGDLYGQRQDEPSIAVSTVNKDHIIAFYNDFRTVDVPSDPPIPGLIASTGLERLWTGARRLLANLVGRPEADRSDRPAYEASSEAGIGMSVSYDGGLTWTGGFVPGLPFDTSPASLASPAYQRGMEGMSDPVVVPGACGRFYLTYLAFTRGGQSSLLVSVLQDLNNSDVEHTFRWLRTTEVELGQNANFGHFVDKPHAAVLMNGATNCSDVTEEVYVTYTTFVGNGSGSKFQSKINFARSVDLGRSFTVAKVDDNYTQSSGTAMVVKQQTKEIFVFWRSFNSPDSIILRKSTDGGTKWTKPSDLLAGEAAMAKFDQPNVSTQDSPVVSVKNEIAFRSNAFPAAAIAPDGNTILVAWQEKVDPSTGLPNPAGSPRIVMKVGRFDSKGALQWSAGRKAVVLQNRPAAPGLGFFNPSSSPGPQVMPSLSCGAGDPNRCLLTYYESRTPTLSANGWMGGYDRVVDLRGILIDASGGGIVSPGSSFQISRYAYRALLKNEFPAETLDYVAPVCQPNGTNCYPALNYGGYPHTGGGTSPFMGDYNDVQPMTSWVKDRATGKWRGAISATDAPYGAAFIAAWADNRNLVRPAPGDGSEWQNFGQYGPAGLGGSCLNPGSRDQNVMTAQVSLGLLVTAPTNYKPFASPLIEFPMTVWNNTGQDRQFELRIAGGSSASFAKEASVDGSYPFPLQDGAVTVFAYSSSSIDVYAFDGNPATVNVTECTLDTCASVPTPLTGSITFNAPSAVPPAGAASPTYTSAAIAINPIPKNPIPKNPIPKNPIPKNPVPTDASGAPVPVYDIIDYSWTVTPASQDDAGSYIALAKIDKAYQDDYAFQVFVSKPSTLYAVNHCEPSNLALGTLIGHISDAQNPIPKNPIPKNPIPKNPIPKNAPLSDVLVQNTTFTLASSTTATSGATSYATLTASSGGCDPTTGGGLVAECTMAAPRRANEVTITVRAYQISANPARRWDPFGEFGGPATPPSVTVADYWCTSSAEGCPFTEDGPDLAVQTPTAGATPTTVQAGQAVAFPTASVTVANAGTQTAQTHRIGYYVSAASSVGTLPRKGDGTIDTTSTVYTRLLGTVDRSPVAAGATELVDAASLTIPLDIPRPDSGTGTYYLYAYVDDLRVVSELDEDNNFVQGGPITVLAPANDGYDAINGLLSPCTPTGCSATGTLPLAWQFLKGGVAVDSAATPPDILIFTCKNPNKIVANPVPDPGSSGWHYSSSFTWQYNWQLKDIPMGCYNVWIESRVTNQTKANGNAFGPFAITVQ